MFNYLYLQFWCISLVLQGCHKNEEAVAYNNDVNLTKFCNNVHYFRSKDQTAQTFHMMHSRGALKCESEFFFRQRIQHSDPSRLNLEIKIQLVNLLMRYLRPPTISSFVSLRELVARQRSY